MLAAAGLHSRLEHPPAMCFLDITGYTRLTQERGDAAAAELAEQLGRLVQRTSVKHGGRPVKWLGDGVMLFFPNPGPGVVAALEMVAGVADAGLPPAHVGLHAGPVIFQEGDYYGQTVNVASRIADYARPGEVLVSQEVVDASGGAEVAFREIGPVELKGVAGADAPARRAPRVAGVAARRRALRPGLEDVFWYAAEVKVADAGGPLESPVMAISERNRPRPRGRADLPRPDPDHDARLVASSGASTRSSCSTPG